MRDLIDYLRIYRARTLPKPERAQGKVCHYQASTKALTELARWPRAEALRNG